jgi:hypothetical protein
LAEAAYDITLFEVLQKHHDATSSGGRLVQIKAMMQLTLTFPVDHIPLYYLGIQIHRDGTFTEVFNGPGALAWAAVRNRKKTKTNLHSVAISALLKLNEQVAPTDRIPRRANAPVQEIKSGGH